MSRYSVSGLSCAWSCSVSRDFSVHGFVVRDPQFVIRSVIRRAPWEPHRRITDYGLRSLPASVMIRFFPPGCWHPFESLASWITFLSFPPTCSRAQIRPALTRSRRLRSFEPCRALCQSLIPAARAYRERYHAGSAEPLLEQAARDLPFDRDWWKQLVGEILLFAAVEIPEFQLAADAWCCLLAPDCTTPTRPGLTRPTASSLPGPPRAVRTDPAGAVGHARPDLRPGHLPARPGWPESPPGRRTPGPLSGVDRPVPLAGSRPDRAARLRP